MVRHLVDLVKAILFDAHIPSDSNSCDRTVSIRDVDDTGRKASFHYQICQIQDWKRCLLCGFEDNSVAAGPLGAYTCDRWELQATSSIDRPSAMIDPSSQSLMKFQRQVVSISLIPSY